MAKGYWIVRLDVHNPNGYQEYANRAGSHFAQFGAKFLSRGDRLETKEGASRTRNVVIEFEDYETALACYNSREYEKLVILRSQCATADLVIVGGCLP